MDADRIGTRAPEKMKRVRLAVFVAGIVASVATALIAVAFLFSVQAIGSFVLPGRLDGTMARGEGFLFGMMVSAIGAAFNWWFGYLTIPAAWLALGFSIGRFPHRGIIHAAPYYRWGAIWGGVLVGGVSILAALFLFGSTTLQPDSGWRSLSAGLGAMIGGGTIGALAGIACAWLFRLIVRPEQQLVPIDTEVFS